MKTYFVYGDHFLLDTFENVMDDQNSVDWIKQFAAKQDVKYNSNATPENMPKNTLLDDFIEICLFAGAQNPDELNTLAHDAWSIAKLHTVVEKDGSVSVKPLINGDPKLFTTFEVQGRGGVMHTLCLETKRLPQFVEFNSLTEKEQNKDSLPISNWNNRDKEFGPMPETLEYAVTTTDTGGGFPWRVILNGGARTIKKKSTPKKKPAAAKPKPKPWKATAKTHTCKDGVKRKVYSDGKGAHAVKCKVGDRFVYKRI